MKLISFDDYQIGVLTDENKVIEITELLPNLPEELRSFRMLTLIERWDTLQPLIKEHIKSKQPVDLDSVNLIAPVPAPRKVYAQPSNYKAHSEEMQASPWSGSAPQISSEQGMFLKASSSVSGPNDPILLPYSDRVIHHESELVMIMGKGGSMIPAEQALDHVFGYTCGLDMTVRGPEDRSKRKSFDSFAPIGSYIITADEISDPQSLEINLWVNEELRQHAFTKDMIVDCKNQIANMSWVARMEPGDLIFTGTPEGVGPVAPGDLVTINISEVGELSARAKARY
ncbi:MAG: fumarylacetoacetate hydrolase family protein [SAR202 cluster bacterium]|nr:fumarylacetoacetate hydrolase family protein [SAR202 cluster bacterium]|tara:strand:- start:2390 stop:3244 length:855 start_codon:yes stop_codon:yes gene_type:complete